MPEMKFACPGCGQHIACDELWGGHTIQCPACKQDLRVPQKPVAAPAAAAPPPGSLVPQPPASPSKLSIGRPQPQPSSPPAESSPSPTPLRRTAAPPPPKAMSGLMKLAAIGAVVIGLGVGGYFGFKLVSVWQ